MMQGECDAMKESPLADDNPLSGLNAMSSPRARLRATLEQAAILERAWCYEDAAHYWLTGSDLTECVQERHWCESRALFCQKRQAERCRHDKPT
ncbi:TPA: ANR family transcriptional regulator [Serratia marcescens]|uniref:ANR family transcriptional regulator n=1 Tax=Serratia marcescens TaxID=615 RepID=UPI0009522889|nr:ANR family transcriptional regulator [Serratia marcescens]